MSNFESVVTLGRLPRPPPAPHTTHFKDPCPELTVSHFLEAAADRGMIKAFNDWSDAVAAAALRLVAPRYLEHFFQRRLSSVALWGGTAATAASGDVKGKTPLSEERRS